MKKFLASLLIAAFSLVAIPVPAQAPIWNKGPVTEVTTGAWTPGVAFGGGTTGITYTQQTGSYIRINGWVCVNGVFQLSAKGSSTGAAFITGLPFAVRNNADSYAAIAIYPGVMSYSGTPIARANVNTTTVQLANIVDAGTTTQLTDANFSATTFIYTQGCYRAE
jgi:hypothetical protein